MATINSPDRRCMLDENLRGARSTDANTSPNEPPRSATTTGRPRHGDDAAFDVIEETLRLTTLGARKPGDRVNVERAARFGDEIGGHLLSGHISAGASREAAPAVSSTRWSSGAAHRYAESEVWSGRDDVVERAHSTGSSLDSQANDPASRAPAGLGRAPPSRPPHPLRAQRRDPKQASDALSHPPMIVSLERDP